MRIKKLSEKIIKQIAAGEVIQRPFNALKELIENSIDAGATEISIHIEKNGLDKIIIIDNGHGIEKDDLEICTQLHTTSKTEENSHMFGTHTLGFRGEALASIAAISDLKIESNGYCWHDNKITNSNITKGTRIQIANMFSNLPARLKFIRSSSIEWQHIRTMIEKFMIHHTKIAWQIYNNGKKIWHLYANETKQQRVEKILKTEGKEFAQSSNKMSISGYLLDNKQKFVALFINNRPVFDKAIAKYLSNIFSEYYMKQEAPGYILNIQIDPFLVDCNIHPAKNEVRLLNYQEIFSMLSFIFSYDFFKKQSGNNEIIWSMKNSITNNESKIEQNNLALEYKTEYHLETATNYQEKMFVNETPAIFEIENKEVQNKASTQQKSVYNIIGQIKNSFIIFETENGIGIFDQHAAHERHVYERMKKQLKKENSQKMLIPIELDLNAEQLEYLANNKHALEEKGIVIEGSQLTHIPNFLSAFDFQKFIENELDSNAACDIVIDRLLADIACKNALKANNKLSYQQMEALLADALENVPLCNHGRPVFKYFNMNEITNWFKRT